MPTPAYNKTMKELIATFSQQLREAVAIGQNAELSALKNKQFNNVLVTGLGGSGMGANIVMDITFGLLKIPMAVNKGYHLPAYVNQNTLLIASSYSGNTEETIQALELGIQAGATVVGISSGGKLATLAKENNFSLIQLPAGNPPRASLGYSFVQQLYVLHNAGLISNFFEDHLLQAAQLIDTETEQVQIEAEKLSEKLQDKIPIIYATDGYDSIALRWKQQFNENSKMLCWYHTIPEMNHNELVGWRTKNEKFAPLFFRPNDAYTRNNTRIELNKKIVSQYTPNVFDIPAKGSTHIAQMMYLNHFGDWLSWHLAQKRGFQAAEIDVINYLKCELSKK